MIYVANFKTNHTRKSTREYLMKMQLYFHKRKAGDRIIVFPPLTALDGYDVDFTVGTQNCYPIYNGAFTGEIGLQQIEEFGIKTILIGHSERREKLGESQKMVAEKFSFFQKHGFEIIYCIGEPIEVRKQGLDAVIRHLISQFEGIDRGYQNFLVAYEPIWAIGTGRTATIKEIKETHNELKKLVKRPLLYGGSVNDTNIAQIANISNVDGVLVGGASLKTETFLKLVLH